MPVTIPGVNLDIALNGQAPPIDTVMNTTSRRWNRALTIGVCALATLTLVGGAAIAVTLLNTTAAPGGTGPAVALIASPAVTAAVLPAPTYTPAPLPPIPGDMGSGLPGLPGLPSDAAAVTSTSGENVTVEASPSEAVAQAAAPVTSVSVTASDAASRVVSQYPGSATKSATSVTRHGHPAWKVTLLLGTGGTVTGYVDQASGVVFEWTQTAPPVKVAPAPDGTGAGARQGGENEHENEHENENEDD